MLKLDYAPDQFTDDIALTVAILEEFSDLHELDDGLATLITLAIARLRNLEHSLVEPFIAPEPSGQQYIH